MRDLVILGNGMAAIRTLEELLRLNPDLYRITIISEEPVAGYNRILLSPLLGGEKSEAELISHDEDWYAARGIRLLLADPAVAIDRHRRLVTTRSRQVLSYDRLVIATGAAPRRLPCAGADLSGVYGFRDLVDARSLIAASTQVQDAVVIGGGFLGVEAAMGLLRRGLRVCLVHGAEWLLNRQLDRQAGELLAQHLRQQGLQIHLAAQTAAFVAGVEDRVSGVMLADGELLPAQLVIQAVGIVPRVTLARAAGLQVNQGVLVDDCMQTFDPRIYAVGECVEHRRRTFGLVAPVYEQAQVCAAHLAEWGARRYSFKEAVTRLKVSGLEVSSLGTLEGDESLYWLEAASGSYRRLWLRQGCLAGAVLLGDAGAAAQYGALLGTNIAHVRQQLLFLDKVAA